MTPYIQQQLKKLCDNPNWYDDMLISWDKNPRNQREAIYNYLSHVQLNGLLENTQIVFTFIDGDRTMLTSGKFLVSFEVPGPLPGTTEGFCEEMNVVYRTEELNTYLRYPKQEINPGHKHSTYIRLKLREILEVNLTDITIIDIISLP